jgi:hypothetical protein
VAKMRIIMVKVIPKIEALRGVAEKFGLAPKTSKNLKNALIRSAQVKFFSLVFTLLKNYKLFRDYNFLSALLLSLAINPTA